MLVPKILQKAMTVYETASLHVIMV